jgi:hypothetical protein
MMEPWWRGIGKRHWVIIVLLALVVAAVTLLWLDAEGAGDSRLCGSQDGDVRSAGAPS